jgi:hypothetical protein
MFDSLADRMREDDVRETTTQRLIRYGAILLVAVVLFGGLYFGVQYLEY